MINRKNFVFSKAAAARILGVPVHHITKIEWWRSVCWVVVKGKSPTFISYQAFKQHFVDRRKEASKLLQISQEWGVSGGFYRVVNPKKGTAYTVCCWQGSIDCECEDYKNQVMFLNKACCKHCYGVIQQVFHLDSLADYVEYSTRKLAA